MQMGEAANNLNNNRCYNEKILFFTGLFPVLIFMAHLPAVGHVCLTKGVA